MLWTIAVIFIILWLLVVVTSTAMGVFILVIQRRTLRRTAYSAPELSKEYTPCDNTRALILYNEIRRSA